MMNTKYIAIISVIVVVVAGLGVFAVLSNDDKEDPVVETDRLLIYGNVNNDDVIDNKDLDLLNDMVDGNKESNEFADVNNDGEVDSKDVDALKAIINKSAKSVYYYNAMYKKAYSTPYPLNNIVIASPELTMYAIALGLQDKIVGTAKLADAKLFSAIDAPELWEVNKAYQWNVGVTKVSNLDADKKADAVITTIESYAMNTESQFEDAKIPVVRLDVRGTSSISAALMLGFLCGAEDRAQEYVKFIDDTQKAINDKVASLADDKRVSAMIVSNKAVYGEESGFTACIKLAGAKLAVDIQETSKDLGDKEWLNNVDPDYVLAYTTVTKYDYDAANAKTYWGTFTTTYAFLDAVPDNFMFVGYYLPDTLRAAYLVEIFYPELFGEGYGDSVHQAYLDKFLTDLHDEGYDVSTNGNFLINKADADAINA